MRPALVASVDRFNMGPAGLVVVVPFSSRFKGSPLHVQVEPPEGGLTVRSYLRCEDVRSISVERLVKLLGVVDPATLQGAETRLRRLLGL